MKYIMLMVLLVGCQNGDKPQGESESFQLNCVESSGLDGILIYRCENKEVICYMQYRGGISCTNKIAGNWRSNGINR